MYLTRPAAKTMIESLAISMVAVIYRNRQVGNGLGTGSTRKFRQRGRRHI
jgi:hypothetical protein